MIKTSVSGLQEVHAELRKELEKLTEGAQVVLVGIHEEASDPDGPLTMAQLGAVHEYGAEIDHPGGTPYGYPTKEHAEKGQVRFMNKGEGFMVLGETEPHKINIPERAWLQPGVSSGNEDYIKLIEDGISNDMDSANILERVGAVAVGKAQKQIIDVRSPPNTPSTIRKKGSANPLVDTGAMGQSVHFKLSNEIPDEGVD